MNIGVLGGTFDPVHVGHLMIAEEARINLQLQEVIFVPAGTPWMKMDRSITPAEHRVHMVRKAIMSNPFLSVSCLEVQRKGPSYSVDTLEELTQIYKDANLFLIVGSDSMFEFSKWKSPERILRLAQLVIVNRRTGEIEGKDYPRKLQKVKAIGPNKIICLDEIEIKVSASDIRKRVKEGKSIRYMVSDEVEQYISYHRLYVDGE
ncbi:nicotinate-nucleotide adenylyltransferase [SAR202 cluster bacterium AD-804-J14_MRT_500m]|nr:nicotinate-nucleotide adenylyltransferase [SAR202 cluster bacterium AD-804-J14_MRT_500m]